MIKEGPFTGKEIQYLKDNFYKLTIREIATNLNRHYHSVISFAGRLNLTKDEYFAGIWTDEEISFIQNNYKIMSIKEIGKRLNRPGIHITKKIQELKLYRCSQYKFTEEDDKFIIENYHKMSNKIILKYIPCSMKQLITRKKKLESEGKLNKPTEKIIKEIDSSANPKHLLHEQRINYLKEHYLDDMEDLKEKLNMKEKGIYRLINELGLTRRKKVFKKEFTETDKQFLKDNCYKMSISELTRKLKNYPREQISSYIHSIAKFGIKRTKCELQIDCFLRILNVSFQAEYKIKNTNYRVDFLLDKNIIIEVHGDYFHFNPTRKNRKEINKNQKRQVIKDTYRNISLSSLGYTVLILWENDIERSPYFVFNHIKNWINYFHLK